MIVKKMDEYAAELATIQRLLLSDPSRTVADALHRDKASILSTLLHKRDAVNHLDLYFKHSPEWVLLHDLHLEMGDMSATIDHLLINREMDIYLIETKYYNADVLINEESEFTYNLNNHTISVASPAERNQQNIDFLASFLGSNGLLPTRFGLTIRPNFHNVVLVAPTSRVQLPRRGVGPQCQVLSADRFLEFFTSDQLGSGGVQDFIATARQVSTEGLQQMAEKLARRHIPRSINLSRRYGAKEERAVIRYNWPHESGGVCARCSKRITARVARYCYDNHDLFAGKAYCFDCQKGIIFQVVM